ncbi:Histone-lysine N-methyltransferase ASHR1 [Hypsizygus marmoreus]|uniref:Histone-lysine N-methyltransferase ASHR1 n=1 Tax=Hypsizygus marmoreus TaxID=39966 RepID=A0A369JCQ5_HYPMA|nr:Histone-lysine N-methyltransferase ASHR1 [Hypsizygus marmoreus]
MSSFSGLKASRISKESKSYVASSSTSEKSPTTHPLQPSSTEGENADSEQVIYDLPSNIDVRKSNTSGRGLWAKAYHRPGDILISVKPHIAVLSNQYLNSHCSNCFGSSPASSLKRCTTCRTIWYCDSTCQNKDWVLHKRECAALQEWAKVAPSPDVSVPSDAVRCLGRLLWRRQQKSNDGTWVKSVEAMQSHRTSIQSSSFELHTHLSHALVRYLGLSSPQELVEFGLSSARDLVDIISRFITNTFTVTTPTLTPVGASISPVVALINHSCDPNAVVVFPRASDIPSSQEPQMQVIALRAIQPDEEILTSYIDTTLPKDQRQKALQETYNFDCSCDLCKISTEIDPREAIWCPNSCGGTCPAPTEENSLSRCTKCKAIVKNTDAILDARRVGQEALDKATALQFQDHAKAQQLTTNLIPILTSSGLTPSSHPLLALSRLHQSLLISALPSPLTQEALDDAIRAATRSTTGLSAVLTYGHPVRGIALAELGKMLAVDEPMPKEPGSPVEAALMYPPSGAARLKLAYETLVRARKELMVGFGRVNEGGEVGREVREGIVALEKELGVWKQGVRNVLELV